MRVTGKLLSGLRGPISTRTLTALATTAWRERNALRRTTVARAYIRGQGIEIGALNKPLRVPIGTRVSYVDRMPAEELHRLYPDIPVRTLVPVDIVDDGERLPTVGDRTQDFVIANHFLEHCENPIGTVGNLLRVLRPGGILFAAIPDKRFTFDRDRPVTSLSHLIEDHESGPEGSRRAHLEEWARLVDRVPEERVERRVAQLLATGYSIHYHVWTPTDILELLVWLARDGQLPFDTELFLQRNEEMIVILRKHEPS